jgi:hypothetical protein
MNSWDKSDSKQIGQVLKTFEPVPGMEQTYWEPCVPYTSIGPNDHELMMKLANAGPVHGKFRRMIMVYVDITAPLYWWKEFDTYKVGTVSNSCSTMHKILKKEFTLDDFSHEHLWPFDLDGDLDEVLLLNIKHTDARTSGDLLKQTIAALNYWRNKYIETKNKPMKEEAKRKPLLKKIWWQIIQLLPSSYNQRRTIMLPYEVLANIYEYRPDHKLDEWREFCRWIESLPYSEIITGGTDE